MKSSKTTVSRPKDLSFYFIRILYLCISHWMSISDDKIWQAGAPHQTIPNRRVANLIKYSTTKRYQVVFIFRKNAIQTPAGIWKMIPIFIRVIKLFWKSLSISSTRHQVASQKQSHRETDRYHEALVIIQQSRKQVMICWFYVIIGVILRVVMNEMSVYLVDHTQHHTGDSRQWPTSIQVYWLLPTNSIPMSFPRFRSSNIDKKIPSN